MSAAATRSDMSPAHAEEAPVRAYLEFMVNLKRQPGGIVRVPGGTAAWSLGYRYVAIMGDDELGHYIEQGAQLVCRRSPGAPA